MNHRYKIEQNSFSKSFLDEHFWVDEYSKIIFPVCFAIFNIVFWNYSLGYDNTLLDEIKAAGYIKL